MDAWDEAWENEWGDEFSIYDPIFLGKAVSSRIEAVKAKSPKEYWVNLTDNPEEKRNLLASLRVGFSVFFRNPLTFAVLEQLVLPSLIEHAKRPEFGEIRIWSAACSAGQEAYSTAILLDEAEKDHGRSIPFRIFATDISEADLEEASRGIYDVQSIQNVSLRHIQNYFSRQGHIYTIAPRLKDRLDFSVYDLMDGNSACPPVSIYGDFHLIFCSNLLFYYSDEARRFMLDKVWNCLAPGGYLITGEVERAIAEQRDGLHSIAPPAAVFQKTRKSR